MNPFRISDEAAATRIQKVYRGHRTRTRLRTRLKAEARIAQREKLQKRAAAMLLFKMTFRRLMVRSPCECARPSTSAYIERCLRWVQKRRRARKAKLNLAANNLQRLWRGHKGREVADEWAERLWAARTIQRKWRSRFAHT